ncbi:MAG: glycine cleavage system protein H [Desulfobacterota bacterium]|nr:glycine cleavage system protein H [Thermodesulfobacteriota bacterium]
MEGFSYVDLFATKSLEYLLVIGFLLLFIPFWKLLNKPARAVLEAATERVAAIGEWFRVPERVYFHPGHSWAALEGGHVVKVGLDDFAQKLVGKIDAIRIPAVGSTVHQGDKAWTLEVDSKAIEMLSPVEGKVVAVNEEVIRSPEKLRKDPYENWLLKVEAPRFSVNKRQLLSGSLAQKWMEEVRENLMSRMNYNLGLLYQDGGELVDGMARSLDPEHWDEIVKDCFLVGEAS